MQPRVGVAVARPRAGLVARLVAWVGAGAVVLVSLHPVPAMAECSEDDTACLEREGDDSSSAKIKQDASGGDASAGSQTIGVAGVEGNVRVEADNRSEFSRARGGDADVKIDVDARAGSSIEVQGSEVTVTADATGAAETTQTARPRVTVRLDQEVPPVVSSTGGSVFSSTASASTVQSSSVDASPLSVAIAAPATAVSTVTQTGDTKVVLRSSGSAVSGAAVAGGQVIGVVAVTGQTVINATNRSVFARARSGDVRGRFDLSAVAGASLRSAPSALAVSSTSLGDAVVGQTASPEISMLSQDASLEAVADSSVSQVSLLETAPEATASAGQRTLSGSLVHVGDFSVEQDLDIDLASGRAVAGGQIIGLAGVSGDVTIDARNQSRFATARGGDARARLRTDAGAGPRLVFGGSDTVVTAEAEGTANTVQTANPTVELSAAQTAPPPSGGGGGAPGMTIDGSNSGALTGSASVQQTASTTVNPVATAQAG